MEIIYMSGWRRGCPTAGLPNSCLCSWGLWPHFAGVAGTEVVLNGGYSVQPKLPAERRHRPSRALQVFAVDPLHLRTPGEVVYHLAHEDSVFYSDTTRGPLAGAWGFPYFTMMEMVGVTLRSNGHSGLRVHMTDMPWMLLLE